MAPVSVRRKSVRWAGACHVLVHRRGRLAGHNREHPYLSRPNLGIRQEEGAPEFTSQEVGQP